MNKGKRNGRIIMLLGGILVLAALVMTIYNSYMENRAETMSNEVLNALDMVNVVPDEELPDYIVNPDMDMPRKSVDGKDYVGTVSIPSLNLTLPVMAEWSYDNFKIAPCVYEGTPYKQNMIIAAHNYKKHFGALKNLLHGDKVIFKDMDGNEFTYEVMYVETLDKKSVEEMSAGEWDLTLFTCTYGGATRVTVRCKIS